MPLNPRSAAKICWNYGYGAMLWTHLSRASFGLNFEIA
jgi:hypothetical protein